MASELLKTLEKIEDGRKSIIDILNYKNANLPANSSLNFIASKLRAHESFPDNFNAIPSNGITPDTDPSLKFLPDDYPEFRSIIEDAELIQNGQDLFVPLYMFIFTTDYEDTEFCISSKQTITSEEIEALGNKVFVGKATSSYIPNDNDTALPYYPVYKYVKTSDGGEYALRPTKSIPTPSVIHTWDTSKDIVLKDGKRLKWFIVYTNKNNRYSGYVNQNSFAVLNSVNLIEVISTSSMALYPDTNSNNSRLLYANRYSRLRFALNYNSKDYWSDLFPGYTYLNFGASEIDEVEVLFSKKELALKTFNLSVGYSANNPTYSKIKVIKTNDQPILTSIRSIYLLYVQTPYILSLLPLGPYGTSSPALGLKYLYIDPDQQLSKTFSYWYSTPSLIDTNLHKCIKEYNSSVNSTSNGILNGGIMLNKDTISFDSLEIITSAITYSIFSGISCKTLAFPALKSINAYPFYSLNVETLSFPSLESSTKSNWIPAVRRVLLPSIKSASQISFHQSYGTDELQVEYIDASGVETGSLNLSALWHLQYVKIPENCKITSINISNCFAMESCAIKELIDKLGDVTDDTETTHTLTIGNISYRVKSEWVDIAESKGWVVK